MRAGNALDQLPLVVAQLYAVLCDNEEQQNGLDLDAAALAARKKQLQADIEAHSKKALLLANRSADCYTMLANISGGLQQ